MLVRSPFLNLQGNPQAEAITAARERHLGGARLRKSDHLLLALLMERCVRLWAVVLALAWAHPPSQSVGWLLQYKHPSHSTTPLSYTHTHTHTHTHQHTHNSFTALPGMGARRKFCREVGVVFERVQEMQTLTQQVHTHKTNKQTNKSGSVCLVRASVCVFFVVGGGVRAVCVLNIVKLVRQRDEMTPPNSSECVSFLAIWPR